jgi:orotate phosphoribosyltransferase
MRSATSHTLPEPAPVLGEPSRVAKMLGTPGALLDGHFELLGGLHTEHFFRFSAIARDSAALDQIAAWLAPELRTLDADAILAPTTAGVGLGWTLATALGVPLHLATVGDDGRPSGVLGAPKLAGKRLLLANDIVTTGNGLETLSRIVASQGADPAGACWFLTRSDVDVEAMLGIDCSRVVDWILPAWPREACTLCGAGDTASTAYDLN